LNCMYFEYLGSCWKL